MLCALCPAACDLCTLRASRAWAAFDTHTRSSSIAHLPHSRPSGYHKSGYKSGGNKSGGFKGGGFKGAKSGGYKSGGGGSFGGGGDFSD